MEEGEGSQRLQSSFGAFPSTARLSSTNRFELPPLNNSSASQGRIFSPNFTQGNNETSSGIPPSHPHMPPVSPFSQNYSAGHSRSKSLSQTALLPFASLPPPSSVVSGTGSIDMDNRDGGSKPFGRGNKSLRFGESSILSSHRGFRRSSSDIPFGSHQPGLVRDYSGNGTPIQLVKRDLERERNNGKNVEGMGEIKSEAEVIDDSYLEYLNLENLDSSTSCGTEVKDSNENHDDLDRTSDNKMTGGDSSANEIESTTNESRSHTNFCLSNEKKDASKRSANEDIAPANRHCRSVSMDSLMGNLPVVGDKPPKLPPSLGNQSSMNGISSNFSLDFAKGEFTSEELQKIMADDRLAEIFSKDPKRVKRILCNRESAVRSKIKKLRYMSELEHNVQTLQTEATTLSAQLALLQRGNSGLKNENNELKIRLQAMEQQAHLRDALNEALTAEVQRLKVATGEMGSGEVPNSSRMSQLTIKAQMFQFQQKQQTQFNNIFHLQQQQQQQQHQQQQQEQQNSLHHHSQSSSYRTTPLQSTSQASRPVERQFPY